ncbi:MAG: GDP-mannose 4,6-dehydratase [Burkholderiales bacterium]
MNRALVCGVAGQDGAYLAKLLLDKGYQVIGNSRDAQAARFENLARLGIRDRVTLETMDPEDPQAVAATLRKWSPQELYNLSGQSSVGLSFERPAETFRSIAVATLNLLEAVRAHGEPIRFFNASSSECFGDVASGLADEHTPFRPRSPYAAAKAAAHWQVANYRDAYRLYACNGILFQHESPLRPERFVTRKITAAARRIAQGSGERLSLGNLAIRRDWGWAPEYVDAMWRMLQQDAPEDLVLATGTLASLEDFVAAAFAAAGLDWHAHVSFDPALARAADVPGFAGDARRAAGRLGWRASVRMPEVARLMLENER